MSRTNEQLPLSVFRAAAISTEGKRRLTTRTFSIVLFTVFIVSILITLMVGTSIYRQLAVQQQAADDARLSLNLIANSVRANDATGAVATGDGPEGPALVLVERLQTGTYETRIYLYEGKVLEEYSVAGVPYTPEKATVVTTSEVFSFSYSKGLLSITTDAGTTDVALRCVGGDA